MANESWLQSLAEELVLEILLHLRTIRSSDTELPSMNTDREKRRKHENHSRRLALYSLCLTSRRLNRLATPVLYSSFTGSVTQHGVEALRRFHRTIEDTKKNHSSHAQHIQYVESRLGEHNIVDRTYMSDRNQNLQPLAQEYSHLLGVIIKSAPKLQHLSVTSVEMAKVSFWKHVLPEQDTTAYAPHFCSLQTLHVQMHAEIFDTNGEATAFRRICSAMAMVPSLSEFRASGVLLPETIPSNLSAGSFTNLQDIDISRCVVEAGILVDILSACQGLRNIIFYSTVIHNSGEAPCDFLPALMRHRGTLKSLCLDFRASQLSLGLPDHCLGSLQQLQNLETLTISQYGFLVNIWHTTDDAETVLLRRLPGLLPSGLKNFTLLFDTLHAERGWNDLEDYGEMWALSEACQSSTTNLKEVSIKCSSELHTQKGLVDAFEQAGVHFKTILEPDNTVLLRLL